MFPGENYRSIQRFFYSVNNFIKKTFKFHYLNCTLLGYFHFYFIDYPVPPSQASPSYSFLLIVQFPAKLAENYSVFKIRVVLFAFSRSFMSIVTKTRTYFIFNYFCILPLPMVPQSKLGT